MQQSPRSATLLSTRRQQRNPPDGDSQPEGRRARPPGGAGPRDRRRRRSTGRSGEGLTAEHRAADAELVTVARKYLPLLVAGVRRVSNEGWRGEDRRAPPAAARRARAGDAPDLPAGAGVVARRPPHRGDPRVRAGVGQGVGLRGAAGRRRPSGDAVHALARSTRPPASSPPSSTAGPGPGCGDGCRSRPERAGGASCTCCEERSNSPPSAGCQSCCSSGPGGRGSGASMGVGWTSIASMVGLGGRGGRARAMTFPPPRR